MVCVPLDQGCPQFLNAELLLTLLLLTRRSCCFAHPQRQEPACGCSDRRHGPAAAISAKYAGLRAKALKQVRRRRRTAVPVGQRCIRPD